MIATIHIFELNRKKCTHTHIHADACETCVADFLLLFLLVRSYPINLLVALVLSHFVYQTMFIVNNYLIFFYYN